MMWFVLGFVVGTNFGALVLGALSRGNVTLNDQSGSHIRRPGWMPRPWPNICQSSRPKSAR